MGNLSEMYYTGTDYLVGFGETRRFRKDAPYGIESVSDLLYLRLGTCTYGRPFNVVTLSVTATALAVQPTLYPNPADQTLQIRIPEASGTAVQATILDIQGRLVQTVSLSESITTLSVTDFPASVYIVRFSGITVSQPLKLFIAH
jgi:hypothetical protein